MYAEPEYILIFQYIGCGPVLMQFDILALQSDWRRNFIIQKKEKTVLVEEKIVADIAGVHHHFITYMKIKFAIFVRKAKFKTVTQPKSLLIHICFIAIHHLLKKTLLCS